MRTMLSLLASALLAASCGGGGGGGGGEPLPAAQFQPLGLLNGTTDTLAKAVSDDGSVVAGDAFDAAGNAQPFRWTAAGGLAALGHLPQGSRTTTRGISSDGSVVVGSGNTTTASSAVFRWTAAGGMQALPLLEGTILCEAGDVSGNGQVVVGVCGGNRPNNGFRWTAASGMLGFGPYGTGTSGQSLASAISRDASTVVGSGHPYVSGAMLWTVDGTPTFLGKLQPDDSSGHATAVSRDGAVVAGVSVSAGNTSRMFRWTATVGMQALQPAPASGPGHWAAAVSGDGGMVVGWVIAAEGAAEDAIAWTPARGTRLLQDMLREDYGTEAAGWRLLRATAISDDGTTIVGSGRNPQGRVEAWRVRLPR